MGEVIEILLVMCVIASAAFAPLGYFIYLYTVKHSEPFAEAHADKPETETVQHAE